MINKKILSYLLLLVALAGLTIYFVKKDSTQTLAEDEIAFALKDTSNVTKIIISDKAGKVVNVALNDKKEWYVNDKFRIRKDVLVNFMETIKRMEVKNPVANAAKENILKQMAARAIKVEVYKGSELVKLFFVGTETPDHLGTYMLLANPDNQENYDRPYAVHIPGFLGFLSPRFSTNEDDWRDRLVMNVIPPDMKQISLQYFDNRKDSSFTIDVNNNKFVVKNLATKQILAALDTAAVRQYVSYFQNQNYEYNVTTIAPKKADSVKQTLPFAKFEMIENSGKKHQLTMYLKEATQKAKDIYNDDKLIYDPDRFYVLWNSEVISLQYYTFGKALQTYSYFIKRK